MSDQTVPEFLRSQGVILDDPLFQLIVESEYYLIILGLCFP